MIMRIAEVAAEPAILAPVFAAQTTVPTPRQASLPIVPGVKVWLHPELATNLHAWKEPLNMVFSFIENYIKIKNSENQKYWIKFFYLVDSDQEETFLNSVHAHVM